MKKFILIAILALAALFLTRGIYYAVCNATYEPQDGDIIFHMSKSSQSTAIQIGTLSRYSHCGIVVVEDGQAYVIEAERGVEKTPIRKWLRRGQLLDHYRVMRLKQPQALTLHYKLGGRYDKDFLLNNGKYYCSELVWELYKRNGITLCETRPMHTYHFLYLPLVQKQIVSRGFDLQQEVVPPVDLVHSRLLRTVSYGYGSPFWL